MSIGEVLSDARCRSGLSIGDVTRQTRIREEIVWAIELDDFSKCGGDFYARGHIRAIAAVVRVDPAPLIAQYDAVFAGRGGYEAYDGPGLLAPAPRNPPSRPAPASRSQRYRRRHRRRVILSTALCLAVLVIFGGEAYHFARDAAPSTENTARAAFNRATTRHQPQQAKAAGSRSSASPSPSPSPSHSPQSLQPVNASAYGPWGDTGDNPQGANMAIDASSSTAWQTKFYTSPDFGGLQTGTGLLIDLGQAETVTSAEISIGSPGAYVELRGGPTDSASALKTIGSARDAGSVTTIRPQEIAVRYLLIWFIRLPQTSSGTYQASIYNVTLQGRP